MFYAVCNISIPFLSENAPKLKSVQTKGILGMQGQQGCKGSPTKKEPPKRLKTTRRFAFDCLHCNIVKIVCQRFQDCLTLSQNSKGILTHCKSNSKSFDIVHILDTLNSKKENDFKPLGINTIK